jgi:hypothetical protein
VQKLWLGNIIALGIITAYRFAFQPTPAPTEEEVTKSTASTSKESQNLSVNKSDGSRGNFNESSLSASSTTKSLSTNSASDDEVVAVESPSNNADSSNGHSPPTDVPVQATDVHSNISEQEDKVIGNGQFSDPGKYVVCISMQPCDLILMLLQQNQESKCAERSCKFDHREVQVNHSPRDLKELESSSEDPNTLPTIVEQHNSESEQQ